MARIAITGKNGQLGRELQEIALNFPNHHFIFTGHEELDIISTSQAREFFEKNPIDYLINCAAYTKVDQAEEEPQDAHLANAVAVERLGNLASEFGIRMIHISTDYVFSGKHHLPYTEEDLPSPESEYGRSKLAGEEALLKACDQSLIIRTSWLYSPYGKNFVKTMLNLGKERDTLDVVFDQVGTPTYARDLADCILNIIDGCESSKLHYAPGIYHYSNEGVCSWYDFAHEIQELAQTGCTVQPIESKNFPLIAPRPAFCVLNKSKIKHIFGIAIPHWKSSLKKCLDRLNE